MKKLAKILLKESIVFQKPNPESTRKWIGSFEEERKKYFIEIWSDKFPDNFVISVKLNENNFPEIGSIQIEKKYDSDMGPCLQAYQVTYSKTNERGWGPILYEVAIELSSLLGGGLMSDRNNVSSKAENIWKNFLNNFGSNLEILQLDDYNTTKDVALTPDIPDDDCIFPELGDGQFVTSLKDIFINKYDRGEVDSRWTKFSPLSKNPQERKMFLSNPLTKVFKAKNYIVIKKLINQNLLYLSADTKKLINFFDFPEGFDPFEKNVKKTVSLQR